MPKQLNSERIIKKTSHSYENESQTYRFNADLHLCDL